MEGTMSKPVVMALVNQKGGTGKTQSTENLGIGLAAEGKKVLLVDMDPQGSLTISLGYPRADELPVTIADIMAKVLQEQPIEPSEGILHHPEGVDLMPANIALSGMEVSLVNVMSREKVLKDYHPDMSVPSWAVRFAASQPNVLTVLSGMSNIQQMKDNLSYMKDFKPLDEKEMEKIEEVRRIIGASKAIPCTACHYCTDGCPMQIPIPDIFKAVNMNLKSGKPLEEAKAEYKRVTEGVGCASDCIQCGQCEGACPQRIKIIEKLEETAKMFA